MSLSLFINNKNQSINRNIINFYDSANNEDYLDQITDQNINDDFINIFLGLPELTYKLFKKDYLIFYHYIDFFEKNKSKINKKIENIIKFLNENDVNKLDNIFESLKEDLKNEDIKKNLIELEEIINDIELNTENYFYYIINQVFNKFETNYISLNGLEILSKQIIVSYYDSMFNKINNKHYNVKDLKIENITDYEEYLRIFSRSDYKNTFIINDDIIEYDVNVFNNIDLNIDLEIEEIVKVFFFYMINIKQINKNLVTWFFFFFKSYIPDNIINDYFSIIFDTDRNVCNYVLKIINFLKIEPNKVTEDLQDLIKNIENDDKYLGKINEKLNIIETYSINDVINNIHAINLIKTITHNNIFDYFKNINYNSLTKKKLYYLALTSPIELSIDSIIFKMEVINNNIIINSNNYKKIANNNNSLYKLYNSCINKNLIDKNKIIFKSYLKDDLKFFKPTLFLIEDINLDDYDKNVLLLNILKKIMIYEIIPMKNESLLQILNPKNFNIQFYKKIYYSIYPNEKQICDGYKKS